MARRMPGARLEIVPDAGHALLLQDAEGTARSVEGLLWQRVR